MITDLYVNGFKSLINFNVNFKPGINVLVGPNGVGKTNICQAMTILASFPTNNYKNVLNEIGGANSIFSKNQQADERDIKQFVIGMHGFYKFEDSILRKHFDFKYKYEVEISLKDSSNLIVKEKLDIERKIGRKAYNQIISVINDGQHLSFEIKDRKNLGDFKLSDDNFNVQIEDDETMWWLMPKISYACHAVGRDIVKIKSINIDPYIARQICDVIEPDIMLGNGKYLANALNRLSKDKLDDINELMADSLPCPFNVRPAISKLSLKRYFTLEDDKNNEFPSNVISDGTIKLLGLLVGLEGQDQYTMIIEEMENYLHPKVNRLLIDYLRETFEKGVCILTTHSETILNLIRPEELIICNSHENFTDCHRIENLTKIKDAIEHSGFGCGYHYIKGFF